MGVRLKKQAAQIISDHAAPDNCLDPSTLTKEEQVTRKEIFQVIADLQLKIKVGFTKTLGEGREDTILLFRRWLQHLQSR